VLSAHFVDSQKQSTIQTISRDQVLQETVNKKRLWEGNSMGQLP